MNKRRTSKVFIVRAAITLLLLLLTSATAWAADGVKYIDADGQEKAQDGVIVLSGGGATELGNANDVFWYVVTGDNIEYTGTLRFRGETHIILADGANISIKGSDGIVAYDNLTIYGQSKGTGSLSTKATGSYGDGIYAEKSINIIGGIITTTSDSHYGITNDNGDITITGGKVTANGSSNGIYASNGNITLGYTNDTDYIFANGYGVTSGKSISIPSDKTMIDGETLYSGTLTSSNINNKILAPNLFGIGSNNDGNSSSTPYIINSPEGLQLLATYVNSGTICVQSSDYYNIFYVYKDKYFKLNDDLAFNSSIDNNFTPIGGGKFNNNYYAFCGSFDGNGHTISGINIDIDDNNYAGIFGYLESGASISNVTLVNASIRGKEFIGGIVGDNKGGRISNCLVANTTITNSITGNSYIGVITGHNSGTLDLNYYGNSTVNENATNVNVGCGTDSSPKDVIENDGAVSATFLTDSEPVPSTLSGKVVFRRVFTGGSASTICLPFAYTPQTSDGTFYTFNHVEKVNDNWEAIMDNVTGDLVANTPYIFVPDENRSIVPILFHGDAAYASTPLTKSGYWTFKGTYEEKKWDSEPTGIYGFSAQAVADDNISQGQFVKVGAYVKIRPLRAYLEYTGSNFPNTRSSLPEEGLPDRIIVRLVGGETSIGQLDMKTGQVNFDDVWYNLNGIRLSGKPTKHGIYVHHGKKVMISTMNNE